MREMELFNLYIDNMKLSVKLAEEIVIPTVKKFDGKVINRRIENELKEKLYPLDRTSISFNIDEFKAETQLLFYGRRSVSDKDGCSYLPESYETIQLCRSWTSFPSQWDRSDSAKTRRESFNKREPDHYFWFDNGNLRLNSECLITLINCELIAIQDRIKTLSECVKHLDEYRNDFEALKKQVESFHDTVPHEFRSFFDLKTYATWN